MPVRLALVAGDEFMTHHLLVPGLLASPLDGNPIPRVPAIELLLSRADLRPAAKDLDDVLFGLFHLDEEAGRAPFCWLADSGEEADGWVLQATPVHLQADRDRLLLFEVDETQFGREHADAYAAAFNDHFADDGLLLKVVSPLRWYLFSQGPVRVQFTPLRDVAGRSVAGAMPRGKEAAYWTGVLNETQMLFFQLGDELTTKVHGAPVINGLWFSGAGMLPEQRPVAPEAAEGDGCLLAGLKRYATTRNNRFSVQVYEQMEKAGRRRDEEGWLTALLELERNLFRLLTEKREIYLYPGNGRVYHWRTTMKYRLWKKEKPFPEILKDMQRRVQA